MYNELLCIINVYDHENNCSYYTYLNRKETYSKS